MTTAAVQFRVLGPLTVVDRDGAAVALGGIKQRCFLALLLLNANRVLSVDMLMDAIWGEQPPATAQTMLHQFASRLRPVVEPAGSLVTRKPGYVLELSRDTVDANRFTALIERGKALIAAGELDLGTRQLDAGLELWNGRALEDLRFEPAITAYADFLEEQRISALEERFEAELELGRHVEVVSELRQLIVEHPERERLAGQLMLALYRAGRQKEALSVYDALRRYLAVELGLSPSPRVQELHAAILVHDPGLGVPAVTPRGRKGKKMSTVAVWTTAIAASVLVAALVSLGVAVATRSAIGPKPLIPQDERLPFPDVPGELFGSYSAVIPSGQSAQTMTLRASDDPVCQPLLGGKGTCFLIHPVSNEIDPGARGQAAFHDGKVVLRYVRIPFVPRCEREVDRYRVSQDQRRLTLDKRVIVMGPFDECSFSAFNRNPD
jgi:DNA-binding SARP family transcriptional activator